MTDSLRLRRSAYIRQRIGKSAGEIADARQKPVRIEPEFRRELAPLARADVANTIRAADLHRRTNLLRVETIGKNARNVVERRKPRPPFRADQHGVVLGVPVGAADQPVEDESVDEALDILFGAVRKRSKQIDDRTRARTTLVFVFDRR